MLDLGVTFVFMCTIFILANVKHVTGLQVVCNTAFERDVKYDGIIPSDENIYTDFLTGVERIRCCMDCQDRRPPCVGVLYNKEKGECKLSSRDMFEIGETVNHKVGGWQYFRKIQGAGGM
jgi:hypothetical protein